MQAAALRYTDKLNVLSNAATTDIGGHLNSASELISRGRRNIKQGVHVEYV